MPAQKFGYHGTKNKKLRKDIKSSMDANLDRILEEDKDLLKKLAKM